MAQIKQPERLTLGAMIADYDLYSGLPDGLVKLPVPRTLRIAGRDLPVPQTHEEFINNLCYGQRLFFTQEEPHDWGIILRVVDGYFYPLSTGLPWNIEKALAFGKKVLSCKILEIYPVAMHLTKLVNEMAERERLLLHREPSKMELAAGVEKLNVFAELNSLDFLRDAMKITVPEVLLTPYKECLVRFMMQKETENYRERYVELMQAEAKAKDKSKYHG
jgi:hypothetical protein